MKKILLMAVMAVVGMTQASAQDCEYIPFVREGVQWVCYYDNTGDNYEYDPFFAPGKNYFTLEIKGDTTIEGIVYKKMHKYSGKCINEQEDTVLVYLREKDKVVYGIIPDGKTYPGFSRIGFGPRLTSPIYPKVWAGEEFPLYDFADPEPLYTTVCSKYLDRGFEYKGVEDITLGEKKFRRHVFFLRENYNIYLIEGIGFDTEDSYRQMGDLLIRGSNSGYPLNYLNLGESCEPPYFLSHVMENGEMIYKGIHYYNGVYPYGDVTGDGEVNVEDVTTLIEIVLNSSSLLHSPADVDGSGGIDIMDITTLIEYVLNQ